MIFDKKITILSTFTEDRIIDNKNRLIKKQKGGPAFYISNVFKKEKLEFNIIKVPIIKVEIVVEKNGEFGRVKIKPETKHVDFSKIKSDYLIISTILEEFNLNGIAKFHGQVFLDIQGYIRDRNNLGGKKMFCCNKEISSSIFCLKGTEEEINYLGKDFIKIKKKKKILIITKGNKGCEAFIFGKRYIVKPKKILNTINTIGAGDTFFAYFMSHLYKNNDPVKSLNYATEKTSKFLEENL